MTVQIQCAFEDSSVELPSAGSPPPIRTNAATVPAVAEAEEMSPSIAFSRQNICESIRLLCGTIVVLLLMVVLCIGVANRWCVLQLHPAILFFILASCIVLLAYVEALHYACVCVEKWDMSPFKETYPRAYKCSLLVDHPDKVKRFLVGRQFFVIFVVFLIAQITSFEDMPADFAGLPPILCTILVKTGLPGVALTLTFGQLISQIFVEQYPVQFLNLYGCDAIIRLSLFTEWIGVCNFSWMLYHIAGFVFFRRCNAVENSNTSSAGTNLETPSSTVTTSAEILDSPMSPTTAIRGPNYVHLSALDEDQKGLSIFDICKYIWSTIASLGAVVIIFYGISLKAYVLPTPIGATYIVFLVVMTLLFYLEGLMIAIVATQYWDKEAFKETYPRAYLLHELINRPNNVKRFIIGRQFCTVLTGFVLAQITTFNGWQHGAYDKVAFYIIVQSGLVGVLTTLAFGQLMPELLAQEFPLRFMNMPGSLTVGRISLFFDAAAVGHCAWTVYFAFRSILCKGGIQKITPTLKDVTLQDIKFSQKTDLESQS